jgi:prevent-host-death family protein
MIEIGAFEAKNTLGGLLDRVAAGEDIVITRRGKPVARLVDYRVTRATRDAAEQAAARIRARAREHGPAGLPWADWKALRDEGRR